LQIPADITPGAVLHGAATLGLAGPGAKSSRQVSATLTVSSEPIKADQGFDDLSSYSRLTWLNSDYAIDEEVVAPFTPLSVATTTGLSVVGFFLFSAIFNRKMQKLPLFP